MYSIIQTIADVAQTANSFHAIEAAGFGGIGLAMWRYSLRITNGIAELKGNLRVMNNDLKNHVSHSPVELMNLVRTENDKVVDRVTAVCVEYGERIETIGSDLADLRIACAKRHGQNGVI